MKITLEAIKNGIYDSVVEEVSQEMSGILSNTPLTADELAKFVVETISLTIDKTVNATVAYIAMDAEAAIEGEDGSAFVN